jgi:hypothetical protein
MSSHVNIALDFAIIFGFYEGKCSFVIPILHVERVKS